MSAAVQRASAATRTGTARPTACTASKSPAEAIGNPASMMSTPNSASLPAMRTFSPTVMLQPGACSPSRRVVSKMCTLEVRVMGSTMRPAAGFGKFIIILYRIIAYAVHHRRPVDLRLQVFATVVAERSFSRAAEKLFRTQPAVSLAVQRLEAEMGEKLIERDMRGAKELVLTDAGRDRARASRAGSATSRQELQDALAELRDSRRGGW